MIQRRSILAAIFGAPVAAAVASDTPPTLPPMANTVPASPIDWKADQRREELARQRTRDGFRRMFETPEARHRFRMAQLPELRERYNHPMSLPADIQSKKSWSHAVKVNEAVQRRLREMEHTKSNGHNWEILDELQRMFIKDDDEFPF